MHPNENPSVLSVIVLYVSSTHRTTSLKKMMLICFPDHFLLQASGMVLAWYDTASLVFNRGYGYKQAFRLKLLTVGKGSDHQKAYGTI